MQQVGFIGDVLGAWLPTFFFLAGLTAALAFGRLAVLFAVAALGSQPARTDKRAYTPLFFDYVAGGGDEPAPLFPPVPAGPWWRRLIADWLGIMHGAGQSAAAFVRGDPLNPWWRISWRGLNRAYSRASWVVFFGLFFGAFVCAAAVSAGFPLGPTAAVYALLGIVWICSVVIISIGLAWAECAFLLVQLLLELATLLGYLAVAAALLLAGFAVAVVRQRGMSYVATLGAAEAPIWKARIVPASEMKFSLRPWALAHMRRKGEREARRAARPPRSRARNLLEFASFAFSVGLLVVVFDFTLDVVAGTSSTMLAASSVLLFWCFLLLLPVSVLVIVDDRLAAWVLRHTRPGEDEVMTEAVQEPQPAGAPLTAIEIMKLPKAERERIVREQLAGAQDEDFEAFNP